MLGVAFAGVQLWKGENATVPPRILKKRSIAFGSWFIFCLGGSFFVRTYSSDYRTLVSLLISVIQRRLVALNSNVSGSDQRVLLLTIVIQLDLFTTEKTTDSESRSDLLHSYLVSSH